MKLPNATFVAVALCATEATDRRDGPKIRHTITAWLKEQR